MSTMAQAALTLTRVTKRYDDIHGIFDISLKVKAGEIFGFLGPNGAGKSTTIYTMLDILRADSGSIDIMGLDSRRHAARAHRIIGYLASDMETDPALSGKQYLQYVAALRGGVSSTTVEQLVKRLGADTHTKIRHLSRGNKQKIGLIAALMHHPKLLILDEPTSGLDPLVQAEFYALLHEHRQAGGTTFISSHILSEVQAICDRVGFIRRGKLMQVSPLSELLQSAPHQVSVGFVAKPPKAFDKLPGLSNIRRQDHALTATFSGDINMLVSRLATHKLTHLQISEANLEELFMTYYGAQESHV